MTGRPRDLELERRLLGAAWELLVERGYEALTLSKVAAEAGAHRSDVYRRWSTKAQLVADTLAEHLPAVTPVDTGDLQSDLQAYVEGLAGSWSAPWIDGLVGLLADLRDDPQAEASFQNMAMTRGGNLRAAVERAVARGDIGEVSREELNLLAELLEGPLMHRRLISRLPLTPDYLATVASLGHHRLTRTTSA